MRSVNLRISTLLNWNTLSSDTNARYLKREILVREQPEGDCWTYFIAHSDWLIAETKRNIFLFLSELLYYLNQSKAILTQEI